MIDVFAWLLLAGAALASFNLVSRVVESQRREIGVGMALGVSPARLAIRPLLFAAEISLLGVVAGVGVGLVFNQVFRGALEGLLALPAWETPLIPGVYARAAALGFAVPAAGGRLPRGPRRARPPDRGDPGRLALGRGGRPGAAARTAAPARLEPRQDAHPEPRPHSAADADEHARNRGRHHRPRRARRRVRLLQPRAGCQPQRGPLRQPTADDGDARRDLPDRRTGRAGDRRLPGRGRRRAHPRPSGHIALEEHVLRRQPAAPRPRQRRLAAADHERRLHPRPPAASSSPPRPPRTSGSASATPSRSPTPSAPGRPAFAPPRATSRSSRSTPTRSAGSPTWPSDQAGRFGLAGATNAVEIRPRGSQQALTRALFAIPGVAFVEPGSAVPDAVRTYMDEFLSILRITQMVTLLLAVLIAFNTMSIATEERRRENATMLAFGTQPRRILRNAVVESALIGTLGTIAGIAFGIAILGWIVNVVSKDTYPELGMPVTLSAASIATAAAVGIVAVGLSPLFGARRLRQMDISSTLRVVE